MYIQRLSGFLIIFIIMIGLFTGLSLGTVKSLGFVKASKLWLFSLGILILIALGTYLIASSY